jgi:hypothetical protein
MTAVSSAHLIFQAMIKSQLGNLKNKLHTLKRDKGEISQAI